jgi:hypothetical protein
MKITLSNPRRLHVSETNGKTYIGGWQGWYADNWQRQSGCGPTAASNIIWYKTMWQGKMENYRSLMHEMFTFVKPGAGGVNTAAKFVNGVIRYGVEHGLAIVPHVLEVPIRKGKRPTIEEMRDFISSALNADAPVAFLNLSNGSVNNLGSWHWVTIIALDTSPMTATISDGGRSLEIDLGLWLRKSRLGGAMVYLTGL